MSKANDERRNWNGGGWIRPEKRLGIYLAHGQACVWCGASVEEEGIILSLDHIIPNLRGGGNEATNLITACTRCNSARGARSIEEFAKAVAEYHYQGQETAESILWIVREMAKRPPRMEEARRIIARRKESLSNSEKVLDILPADTISLGN